jgi:hypothetical protein
MTQETTEGWKMETVGTARLADDIPAARAITAVVPRGEFAAALQDPDSSPELYLDIDRQGEERSTIGISWSHDELEQLLGRASGDDILLTFDRDELQSAFDDVEAHGLRQKALIFTVAAAGALGSGATIANAAPSIDRGSDSAASVAAVQTIAADSIGGLASNVHTPGLQTGDVGTTASTASVHASTAAQAADPGLLSNVHTPGLQTGDEGTTASTASVHASTGAQAVDTGLASNVHTPGLQTGDEGSTAGTTSVKVSAGSSSSEFFGVPSRDVTDGLIAGGVLLAIAGAGFAGSRRMGTPRPA